VISSTTRTAQDCDGDRIPNANDNCPNLPYTRYYKEGDTAVVAHSNRRKYAIHDLSCYYSLKMKSL
jgi:hypothetical protein